MKENTGCYGQVLDKQLEITGACRDCGNQLAEKSRDLPLVLKKHIVSGLVTCGIGAIMFLAIVLFLQQLAEYGW